MDDLLDLKEAATELGLAPVTLRQAIRRGTFRARKFGNAWVTTRQEVERYRRENLGRAGRSKPILLESIDWPGHDPIRVVGYPQTPVEEREAVYQAIVDFLREADGASVTMSQIRERLHSDIRTGNLILNVQAQPPFVGIAREIPFEEAEA